MVTISITGYNCLMYVLRIFTGQVGIPSAGLINNILLQCFNSANCAPGTEGQSVTITPTSGFVFNSCCLTTTDTPVPLQSANQLSYQLNDGECRRCDGEV